MQTDSMLLPQPLWDSAAPWSRYSERVGVPREGAPLPDFLIICPSRTGTTWVSRHLGRHPSIYLPAGKELRYFDTLWQREGIEQYQEHFREAGSRLKGESSPPYALLPTTAIRTIQRINPRLKLIFLARRPAERAWSHTRHCCRHYEGVFRNRTAPLTELTVADLTADFLSDYALSSADYSGTLRRWLRFFPSGQFHVRYFESAVREPDGYFQDLLRFLNTDGRIPEGDLHLPINEGVNTVQPVWAQRFLEELLAWRQTEIESFLERTFGLPLTWTNTPARAHEAIWVEDTLGGWRIVLDKGTFEGVHMGSGKRIQAPFLHDLRQNMTGGPALATMPGLETLEDQRLATVLRHLGEDLTTAAVVHLGVLEGFNIIRWKKLFFGIRQTVGAVDVTQEENVLRSCWGADDLVIAPNRLEAEMQIQAITRRLS